MPINELGGETLLTCEDVLDSICNDEVLVRHKAVDGLFVTLGYCLLWGCRTCNFRNYNVKRKNERAESTIQMSRARSFKPLAYFCL